MAAPVIEVAGLTHIYRGALRRRPVTAIRALDLVVEAGSSIALIGPNGAGKTTTILAMLGLIQPTAGSVSLFGHPPQAPEAHRRVGFQSEIFYTYPFRTALGALSFYGRLSGLTRRQIEREAPRQLARVGLGDAMKRRVGGFSKGMVQRLGLAQAVLHGPELLILDEPTTGLDPGGRQMMWDFIAEERARGRTVLFSSHILGDVERVCDRVVIMHKGEIVFDGSIDQCRRDADEWEVEVVGLDTLDAAAFDLASVRLRQHQGGPAAIVCTSAEKRDLLRRLLDLPVEIGTVNRTGAALERLYRELTGGDNRE